MALNTIGFEFKTLQLLPPLSLRIKDGLPRLVLDRLPGSEEFGKAGWLKIEDGDGVFLVWGFIDPGNKAVHLISNSEADPFSDLLSRVETAIKKRLDIKALKGEAVRLVNSTGDNLSGFTLDSYGKTLILSLESKSLLGLADTIHEKVLLTLQSDHIILKVREKRPQLKGQIAQSVLLGKPIIDRVRVKESGISYLVLPMGNLDTGLFLDLRGVRKKFALNTKDCGVLNLFSYTGAFSLSAAIAGARRVVSVEIDAGNQNWAKENFKMNGLDPKDQKFLFVKDDVFRYLDKLEKRSETFERIILDPPARAQIGTGRFFLKSDLPKLVASCLSLLTPKGRLLVTDNTMIGTEEKLVQMINKGADMANTSCSIVRKFKPEPDFPVNPLWPKGRGVIAMEVEKR
ncbi:MAG: class I SAM-dependent rRNA methyltransferase [Candidatus Anammoxibacter sp.]